MQLINFSLVFRICFMADRHAVGVSVSVQVDCLCSGWA